VILLDTQVVIWLALAPERISPAAAASIQQAVSMGEAPQISAVSLYEVANAIRRGRIQPAMPIQAFLNRMKSRFTVIPVSETIAVRAGELPEPFHGDPMDRMIAATAIMEKCTLITADNKILAAKVCKVLW
jgi:PIN domain nuclease of toxin-antitoxin system